MPTKFDEFAAENLRGYNVHFINKAQQAFNAGRADGIPDDAEDIICKALIDADPCVYGYHLDHFDMKRPAAKAVIRALNKEGE